MRAFFVTAAAAFGADDGAEGRPAGTSDGFGANDEWCRMLIETFRAFALPPGSDPRRQDPDGAA